MRQPATSHNAEPITPMIANLVFVAIRTHIAQRQRPPRYLR